MATSARVEGNWQRVDSACASRTHLYVIEDTILYRVAPSGESEPLTNRWRPRAMTAFGDSLYIFEDDDHLYRAPQATGEPTALTSGWRTVRAVAATRDAVFVATGSAIYQLDPDSGEETPLPERWDVKDMVGLGTFLFVFEVDGTLRRLDTRDGTYATLPGNWPLTLTAASQDAVYAVDDTVLYRIEPRTGDHERIDNGFLTTHLVALGADLYSFERGGLYRVTI